MHLHRSFRMVSAVLFALFLWCIVGAWASDTGTSRWIVVYKSPALKTMAVQRMRGGTRHSYGIIPGFAADLTASEIEQIRRDPSVAFIEPDAVRYAIRAVPILREDVYGLYPAATGVQEIVPYGIDLVHAPDAWPYTMGTGVKVAEIDTGIDLNHPDRPLIVGSTTFTNQPVQDSDGHGTHTAGTIAAPGNNGGVVGVAPKAGLLIAQVFGSTGSALDSDIIAAIDWAVKNGANVINMSLGGATFDQALDQACANAVASGAVLVAAAGNGGDSTPSYPADYPSVISVAAVDQSKQRASFSSFGSSTDLSAPGVGVLSTVPVGTGWLTSANWSGGEHQSSPFDGSANGSVSGSVVYCGLGNPSDFPSGVKGKIAHIRRGTLTFQDKVSNAVAAGAVGVIISNNALDSMNGSLNGSAPVVVVGVSQANGDDLQTHNGIQATIANQKPADYESTDGTSMAAPHVSGVAALLVAARHGQITPAQVRSAMENSAQDLGATGRDDLYGFGLVDASAALAQVIPVIQSLSANPTSVGAGRPVTITAKLSLPSGVVSVTANGVRLSASGSTWTGAVPADSALAVHSVDVVVSDNWGNVTHNTTLTYTTVSAAPPAISIGAPSASAATAGPVSYTVTYSDATSVTLKAGDITLNRTGNAAGTVAVSGSGSAARTVTISNITGDGTLGISIAAGTASNSAGSAPAAGPSATFSVDTQAPAVAFTFPTNGAACTRNTSDLQIAGTATDSVGIAGVTWKLNGGAGGSCVGTTKWSANGITLAPGLNELTVTATDSAGNKGSATLAVTYTDAQPGTAWRGIAMVSLPIIPDSTDPEAEVGFSGSSWWMYDPVGLRYMGYPNQQTWFVPPASTPGRGFWAVFPASGATIPHGSVPTEDQPITIHLRSGWNLVGQPFIKALKWDTQAITVVTTTGSAPAALMDSGGAVAGYAWGWDPAKGAYYPIMDPAFASGTVGRLEPWQAYWVRAFRDCDLILPAP